MKYILVGLTIAVALISSSFLLGNAYAKGLKVYLSVNSNQFLGETNINTFQFGGQIYTHSGFINQGSTQLTLQYPDDLVQQGNFRICIQGYCGEGYNSPEKKPESVFISIGGSSSNNGNNYNDNSVQQSPSQSQSQSLNNDNTIIFCAQERCDVQN